MNLYRKLIKLILLKRMIMSWGLRTKTFWIRVISMICLPSVLRSPIVPRWKRNPLFQRRSHCFSSIQRGKNLLQMPWKLSQTSLQAELYLLVLQISTLPTFAINIMITMSVISNKPKICKNWLPKFKKSKNNGMKKESSTVKIDSKNKREMKIKTTKIN
jgi:hypothetical protein